MKPTFFVLLALLLPFKGIAQDAGGSIAVDFNAFTRVPPPSVFEFRDELGRQPTFYWHVDYDPSFLEEAKPAFEQAIRIWSYLLQSSVAIRIHAKRDSFSMGPNILAQAYATNFFVDPSDFTYYPVALAEAKRVQELNGVNSDIEVIVDSRYDALWYYGSDGITPPGKYDFLTVMMHELAHGFGFAHSFSDTLGIGRRGVGPPPLLPMIFDKFCGVGPTYPNANNLLISPNYPDSSAALSQQLRSNNIHFVGRNTWEMRDTSVPAKLYAPPAWKRGSSLSHLDSLMYGTPGNRNSLMVPYRNKAEAVHSPGEIGLEMLEDLGWWTNRIITFTKPVAGIDISLGDSLCNASTENGLLG